MSNFVHLQRIMTYERYKDLKVILKDGSVMVSRVIMHAHNNFFSQILEATPEITEVECRELTVREMKMYLQYVYKVREFVFDEENIFDMINVDQAIQSDDLTTSIVVYTFRCPGDMVLKAFIYCRNKFFDNWAEAFKLNIQDSCDNYLGSDRFNEADFKTLLDIFDDTFIPKKPQETILKCFLGWTDYKFEERKHYFLELLKKINFRFMSCEDIKKIFDLNIKFFEIDRVAIFIHQTLYKRGFSINPNCKPTDILMIGESYDWEQDSETTNLFHYNINSHIFAQMGTLSEYTHAFGFEVVEDNLLMFGQEETSNLLKFDFMTRKTSKHLIKDVKNRTRNSNTCKVSGTICMFEKNEVLSLDYNKMQWNFLSTIPLPNLYKETVAINNCVYVIMNDNLNTLRFDMREGLWESCGPKSSDTHNFAVCHYDDRIMAAGGITELFEDEFTYHTSCEVLETRTNSWRFVGELPVALGSSKCCQVDNIVQLFGGVNDDDDSDSVFIFDTSAETWTLSESVMIDQFTILSLNLI